MSTFISAGHVTDIVGLAVESRRRVKVPCALLEFTEAPEVVRNVPEEWMLVETTHLVVSWSVVGANASALEAVRKIAKAGDLYLIHRGRGDFRFAVLSYFDREQFVFSLLNRETTWHLWHMGNGEMRYYVCSLVQDEVVPRIVDFKRLQSGGIDCKERVEHLIVECGHEPGDDEPMSDEVVVGDMLKQEWGYTLVVAVNQRTRKMLGELVPASKKVVHFFDAHGRFHELNVATGHHVGSFQSVERPEFADEAEFFKIN